jgi:hypothetical protein
LLARLRPLANIVGKRRRLIMRRTREFPYAVLIGIAVQFALASIVTTVLLKGRISPLPNSSGQILYALTAASQVLASLLGLLLAVALVVAQLTSSYSRTTTTNLIIRPTLAIGTLYTVAIASSVALAATARPTPMQATVSLAFSFLCLFLIVPFFLLLKRQLSIESAVLHLISSFERACKRGNRPELINSRLRHITEYGVAAASERDLNAYSSVVSGLIDVTLTTETPFAEGQMPGPLTALTTIIAPAEGESILSSVALHAISEKLVASTIFNGSQKVEAQLLSQLVRPLIVSLLQKQLNDDHTTNGPIHFGIELLSAIGRTASALGDSTTTAAAVAVLAEVKFKASELQQLTVAGRSARALARIGRPSHHVTQPLRPSREEQLPSARNLLLNGGFEFGHDAGYGREPGWFSALNARQLDSRALPDGSRGSTRDWIMRLRSNAVSASFAQDIVQPRGISPGDTFLLVGRLATDNSPALARLALWALGGIEERGVTNISLSDNQPSVISCQLDVRFPGHHSLRAELYLDTVQADYHLDDVFLVRSLTSNGGLELGTPSYWELRGSGQVTDDKSTPPWLGGEFVMWLGADASLEQTLDLTDETSRQIDHLVVTFATRSNERGAQLSITVSAAQQNASACVHSTSEWCRVVRVLPIAPGSHTATLTFVACADLFIDAIIVVATKGAPHDGWSIGTSLEITQSQVVTSQPYGVSTWLAAPRNPLHVRRIAGHLVEPGHSFSAVMTTRLRTDSSIGPCDTGEIVTASLVGYDHNGTLLSRRSASVQLEESGWQLVWVTFDVDSWDYCDIYIEITCVPKSHEVEISIPTALPIIETCGPSYGAAVRTGDRG